MTQDNSDQRAFWEGASGRSWISQEKEQDALLESVAERVAERAGFASGMRVLDVGSGTGALSVMAAETVGPAGRVLAADISAPLITRAAERLAPFDHASTVLGDAATHQWEVTDFDIAVSRFGVMFFSDPAEAFRNIARALRAGGRICFAAWGHTADNPFWSVPTEIATRRLGFVPGTEPDLPGPMGLATPSLAIERLTAAGLVEVEVTPEDIPLRYPGTAADLATVSVMVGPARRIINAQNGTAEDEIAIRDELTEAFESIVYKGDGVALPSRINILTARTNET